MTVPGEGNQPKVQPPTPTRQGGDRVREGRVGPVTILADVGVDAGDVDEINVVRRVLHLKSLTHWGQSPPN